jgi:transposase-like protein
LHECRGVKSRAELCCEHQIAAAGLADWRAIILTRGASLFDGPEPRRSHEAPRIAELERLVGRLALENDLFKKVTSILHHGSRPSASRPDAQLPISCAPHMPCAGVRAPSKKRE